MNYATLAGLAVDSSLNVAGAWRLSATSSRRRATVWPEHARRAGAARAVAERARLLIERAALASTTSAVWPDLLPATLVKLDVIGRLRRCVWRREDAPAGLVRGVLLTSLVPSGVVATELAARRSAPTPAAHCVVVGSGVLAQRDVPAAWYGGAEWAALERDPLCNVALTLVVVI